MLLLSRHEGGVGKNWGGMKDKWILDRMDEWVRSGEGQGVKIRWWRFLAVRHQVDIWRRSTSPIFAEPFGDLSLVCLVVLVHAAGG